MNKKITTLLCIGALLVLVSVACTKQTNCIPGAKSYANPDGGMKKSSKNDPCAGERAALAEADSLLYQVYGPDVRNAVYPALYDPIDYSTEYWSGFNGSGLVFPTLLDSAKRHIFLIEGLWSISNPFYVNDENLRKLHGKCEIYVIGHADFMTKDSLLNDCEKVSVWEPTLTFICNAKGYWQATNDTGR